RRHRPGSALPAGLRGVPQVPRGDPRAHFPGNDGAGARWHGQDHHRPEQPGRSGAGHRALPAAERAPAPAARRTGSSSAAAGGQPM
ncbi:MAG: HflK protein, partial [uncultured Microvirga sp.]